MPGLSSLVVGSSSFHLRASVRQALSDIKPRLVPFFLILCYPVSPIYMFLIAHA